MNIRKRAEVSLIMIIIILLIVLVLLILGIKIGIIGGFDNLIPFASSENFFAVSKHCELLCVEKNSSMFCNDVKSRPLPLSLGNRRVIKGSCAALSDIGLKGFDGISKCPYFECSGYEPAVCKIGRKVVDCSEFG